MAMGTATMLRLQREIIELEKEPLEGIQYHFCDSNVKRMCLILTPQSGPFSGLRLHLEVCIPDDYPRSPPVMSIQTKVEHPNVRRSDICCDILRPRNDWKVKPGSYNGGYTPAYLLKYIFLQLLSFFSVNEVDQDDGGTQRVGYHSGPQEAIWKQAEKEVRSHKCRACGFNISISSIVDATSSIAADIDVDLQLSEPSQEKCSLGQLDAHCWLHILDKLSDQDMHLLARAWPPVKQLQQKLLIRRQLVCFYLRKSHVESVLGIGLRVEDEVQLYPRSGFVGRAATVQMLDLVSEEAYNEHNVRTGTYGEYFNVFLPIAIDPSHFRRAEATIKSQILYLHRLWVRPGNRWPLCILEVLPPLMNNMVLELVKDCDLQLQTSTQGGRGLSRDQRWTVKRSSEKALQGYCLLLDLFGKLATRFPEVERELRRRVTLFRESQEGRHKSRTPDLGQFLTYLLVLKEDWGAYCVSFIEELLSRNVVWYLQGSQGNKGLPHLAHLEGDKYVSRQRLRETFSASSHSLKLLMFQVSFLRLVSKGIDNHYGYPSAEDSTNIFQQTQGIYAVKDWDDCLRVCEYKLPNSGMEDWRPHVCKMLKMAVLYSEKAKYHVVPYSDHQVYYWRKLAEPSCPKPSYWHRRDPEKYSLIRVFQPGSLSFFPKNR